MAGSGPDTATATDVVRMEHVSMTFPGTKALDEVDFSVRPGEVHALVGHNGSGKSTLIKILAGYHGADAGSQAWVSGQEIDITSEGFRPPDLSFVHQDLGLVLELDALDNLALHGGFRTARFGRIDWAEQRAITEELLGVFDISLDLHQPLAAATPVERTVVAIAAALQGQRAGAGGLLVLDEPTAVLPINEVERLYTIVKDLRARGVSILYVSHRLDEIFELADRVTVLRNGRNVLTADMESVTKRSLVAAMLGFDMEPDYRAPVAEETGRPAVLEVRDLKGRYARKVSLTLHQGEILGLAGLAGSGREEVPYALAGAVDYPISGEVRAGGEQGHWQPVGRKAQLPLAFVPADRGGEGIIANMSVAENLSLSVLDRLGRTGHLSHREETRLIADWAERLGVKMAGADDLISTLSGGNQQKILIGRCLAKEPEVLVLCEPTAGVDVGARRGIYDLLAREARRGLAVVVSSTDLDDLLAVCTRVLVFNHGVVTDELHGEGIAEHALVHAIEESSSNLTERSS
jgi:ribose transport system ATP-binding protein